METTLTLGLYWRCIEIMENKMETRKFWIGVVLSAMRQQTLHRTHALSRSDADVCGPYVHLDLNFPCAWPGKEGP